MRKRKPAPKVELRGSGVYLSGGVKLALATAREPGPAGIASVEVREDAVVLDFATPKAAREFYFAVMDKDGRPHLEGAEFAEWWGNPKLKAMENAMNAARGVAAARRPNKRRVTG